MSSRTDCPLRLAAADFGRFREVLRQHEFTEQGIPGALGTELGSISSLDVPLLLRATRQSTPLHTLIRLFLMGVPVEEQAACRAAQPMTLDEWQAAGLVRRDGGLVTAEVRLLPVQGMWLAFDLPPLPGSPAKPDYVMGVGSSTLTLANATIRRPARVALDLGTGCGLLAFLAARHSQRVLAVDRNPRAVSIAAFNAALNGLAAVECREGDLFQPVREERFDLVVSNPPFVISPESHYIYRDSGMLGDEITQRIVREVPPQLNEGGFCQILCNWAHVAGQDWRERLAGWFAGTGCDAWVMRTDTMAADTYAAKWIRHTERDDAQEFARRFDRWMAYYEQERIEAVSGGLITIRRRTADDNWYRGDDGPPKMVGPAGASIASGFALHDFLQFHREDRSLLAQRLRTSPDAQLEQRLTPAPQGWQIAEMELRLQRGLAYVGGADPYLLRLLARCDGQRPLEEILVPLVEELGGDRQAATAAFLTIVRRLIERGFLLPAVGYASA